MIVGGAHPHTDPAMIQTLNRMSDSCYSRGKTMKRSLGKAIVLVALACTHLVVLAQTPSQTPSVDFGRTTVQFSSNFASSLQGLGVVVTDLKNNPLQNNAITLRATGGAVDLTTSAGEVEHTGGLLFNASGTIIRVQNLVIDTSNPAAPVITAAFVVNDHFVTRLPVFNIQPPAGFTLPLQLQSGVFQENGLILTLAPATATALNNVFGAPVMQAGANIGTASAYVVFAPVN
jgi:hypothetical protein